RVGQKETPEAIAFHFSVFAAVTLALIAVFDRRTPTSRDAALMVVAGVCAGFAQLAMTRAYTLDRAARVGGFMYLSVVVSALLGALALGEAPNALAIAGMLLVIVGGVVSANRRAS
ncbi:MAG TPA: EamA family transporter, partial [Labilithrix sp.]